MYGVGVKGSLQLSSLQKLSRIKYHDINEVKHCSIEHKVSAEQISSCDQCNESDLPSPSLLHAPKVSLQLENCVQVVDSRKECTDNNSAILLSESQCPSDLSHTADFPLKRKRKFTCEEFEQSPTEDTVTLVHEGLTQCHSGAIALPKVPVFGSDFDSSISDNSVFTTVKKYKCRSSGNDGILRVVEKTSRTAGSDWSKCSIPKYEAKFRSQTTETKRLVHTILAGWKVV